MDIKVIRVGEVFNRINKECLYSKCGLQSFIEDIETSFLIVDKAPELCLEMRYKKIYGEFSTVDYIATCNSIINKESVGVHYTKLFNGLENTEANHTIDIKVDTYVYAGRLGLRIEDGIYKIIITLYKLPNKEAV